jgi:hypothetical protein
MPYVVPTTVVAASRGFATDYNVIVNDVIDHETRIVAVETIAAAVPYANLASDVKNFTISTPTFTTNVYTPVLTDADNKLLLLTNGATAGSFTVPLNSSVAFAIGCQLNLVQTGTGQITVNRATSGVTINGSTSINYVFAQQYSMISLVKTASDTWVLTGDFI